MFRIPYDELLKVLQTKLLYRYGDPATRADLMQSEAARNYAMADYAIPAQAQMYKVQAEQEIPAQAQMYKVQAEQGIPAQAEFYRARALEATSAVRAGELDPNLVSAFLTSVFAPLFGKQQDNFPVEAGVTQNTALPVPKAPISSSLSSSPLTWAWDEITKRLLGGNNGTR